MQEIVTFAVMKSLLKEIIAEFHDSELPQSKEREIDIPLRSGKIISLIGPRRSGKSWLFFRIMNELLESGNKKENLIYFNFEDERFELRQENLDLILHAYRELYPENKLCNCFFFFDEIQNVPGWEKFTRRIYDNYTQNLFITGSNANLLSSEIATALRGRTISFEILPLSFREYLRFREIDFHKPNPQTKAEVSNAFDEYLHNGGFPEIMNIPETLINRVFREYFDVMVYRDVIQRFNFTNLPVVKYFLKKLAANCCSYMSVHKTYKDLRSQGYKLDKNLLYKVLDAGLNSYFAFGISKFHWSELKSEGSDKKMYFIDNGLLNRISFKFSKDYGTLLENAVYRELRRTFSQVYYFKERVECDFIVQTDTDELKAVQVSYDMSNPDTRSRELRGVTAACNSLGLNEGYIITYEEEAEMESANVSIKIIPAVKFFLNTNSIFDKTP